MVKKLLKFKILVAFRSQEAPKGDPESIILVIDTASQGRLNNESSEVHSI